MTRKKLFQKLGIAEGAPLADRIARYRAFAVDAQPEEAAAMAADLAEAGDPQAAALATKFRRFAGNAAASSDDDDAQTTLARKLGLDAASTPDEMQEAFARYASSCKMKFAECMDSPADVSTLVGEVQSILDHEAAEHMDAYAPHFEGLKRMAAKMKRFAGEPGDPTVMDDELPPTSMSEDPEGDAVIHNFARRRGIDVRRTPRAVILGAMAAGGGGIDQGEIDRRVKASLATEALRQKQQAGAERADQLFHIAVRAGFDKSAKQGFMAMARADPGAAETFVRSLPGAKVLTRMTAGGDTLGARSGVTPQAGLRPGGSDERRVNVEFAERADAMVERAKTDPQTMSRLVRIAGANAHEGMLLAAAQQLIAKESPEIVEWAEPDSAAAFGLT